MYFFKSPTGRDLLNCGEYFVLRLNGTAPKFEKGFTVLSLKSEDADSSSKDFLFSPGDIVSGPNKDKDSERKTYEVKFEDCSIKIIHEEFIVPPKEFRTREGEYFHTQRERIEKEERERKDEKKSGKESERGSEESDGESEESESESEEINKKESHKKRHHKHHKHESIIMNTNNQK